MLISGGPRVWILLTNIILSSVLLCLQGQGRACRISQSLPAAAALGYFGMGRCVIVVFPFLFFFGVLFLGGLEVGSYIRPAKDDSLEP